MSWPINREPKKFAMDLTVPQRTRGDRYWARITMKDWSIITQWRGTPQQIDQNCRSWYAREALAVEIQLIVN